jgi:hypothetical protein
MKPLDANPFSYVDAPPALRRLLELMVEGFENPEGLCAKCQFVIAEGRRAHPIAVEFDAYNIRFGPGVHQQPHATFAAPLHVITWLVTENQRLDLRSHQWARECIFKGDAELLFMLLVATQRPNRELAEEYCRVTQQNMAGYRIEAVECVVRPTEAEIEAAIADGRPMLASGFEMQISHRDWTLDLLEQRRGDVAIDVAGKYVTIADFITRTRHANEPADRPRRAYHEAYTAGCLLPSELRADFPPAVYTLDRYRDPQLWLGAVSPNVSATKLHRDPRVAFLHQVIGRKHFRIYAPNQSNALYVMKAYNKHQRCWVWPEAPDYIRYPAFRNARPIDVIVEPGQVLVLPIGWFHTVYCLDSPTLSISYFLKNEALPEDRDFQHAVGKAADHERKKHRVQYANA